MSVIVSSGTVLKAYLAPSVCEWYCLWRVLIVCVACEVV
jgi:hypothetical protein